MGRFIWQPVLLIKFSYLPAKYSAAPWWLSSQSEFLIALLTKCERDAFFPRLSGLRQKQVPLKSRFSCCFFQLVTSPELSQRSQGLLELLFTHIGRKKELFLGRSKSTEILFSCPFLPQSGLIFNRLNSVEKPQEWGNEHSPCLITW